MSSKEDKELEKGKESEGVPSLQAYALGVLISEHFSEDDLQSLSRIFFDEFLEEIRRNNVYFGDERIQNVKNKLQTLFKKFANDPNFKFYSKTRS